MKNKKLKLLALPLFLPCLSFSTLVVNNLTKQQTLKKFTQISKDKSTLFGRYQNTFYRGERPVNNSRFYLCYWSHADVVDFVNNYSKYMYNGIDFYDFVLSQSSVPVTFWYEWSLDFSRDAKNFDDLGSIKDLLTNEQSHIHHETYQGLSLGDFNIKSFDEGLKQAANSELGIKFGIYGAYHVFSHNDYGWGFKVE